jgi:nucleoside-diphosphate-sugar epimerase
MMRVFLAGATGVLGHRALPLMLEAGHDVTAVARSLEKRKLLDRLGARGRE